MTVRWRKFTNSTLNVSKPMYDKFIRFTIFTCLQQIIILIIFKKNLDCLIWFGSLSSNKDALDGKKLPGRASIGTPLG